MIHMCVLAGPGQVHLDPLPEVPRAAGLLLPLRLLPSKLRGHHRVKETPNRAVRAVQRTIYVVDL